MMGARNNRPLVSKVNTERRAFIQRAAALGLMVAGSGWQRLLAEPIDSGEVRGHVVAGERPLSGVRVSDGFRVTVTDDAGRFALPVGQQSGPFLFVTTPRGYWTSRFYVPTASAVQQAPVFRMQPHQPEPTYSALYVTDVHLGEGHAEQSYASFAATIDELNHLEPRPAVCWVGGDLTLQSGRGRQYVDIMSRLKIPVRTAVGNHEMIVGQSDPREEFQRLFGPTYYSFDIGQVHYVTLDGCHVNRQAEGYKNVEGLLSQRELHWLVEDLRHVPSSMATVVAVHIPLISDYPERRGTTAEQVPFWIVQNAEHVVELLARHGATLVLQGHLHENQRIVRSNIEFVESISVCGRWWKTPPGQREHGVSGEPRGYRILEVDGTAVNHRYQSSAEARVETVGEIVGQPARLPAGRHAVLGVNIFDAGAETTVSARIDDGRFHVLQPGTDVSYHEDLQPAHHWRWPVAADALTPGTHRLQVLVQNPGQRDIIFHHDVTV